MKENPAYQTRPRVVIQAVDENGNPLGEPVEVYESASVTLDYQVKLEAVSASDNRKLHIGKVIIQTSKEAKEVKGVYGILSQFNNEDTISIILAGNEAKLGYGYYGKPAISKPTVLSARIKKKNGQFSYLGKEDAERGLPPCVSLPCGDAIDLRIEGICRETRKLPDGTPVVDEKALIRVLYQQ
jgi:hypothetical protein